MIYFLRHGKDDESYIGGWSDVDLIPEGIKQVEESESLLKTLNIKKIISSDIKRARTTAQIVSKFLNLPVEYSNKFRELNKGNLTGLSVDVAKQEYFEYTKKIDINIRFPNGESFIDFYERVKSLLPYLESLEDDTLIVTHRGFINMIYFIMNNRMVDNNKEQFGVTHGSIHGLDIKNGIIKKMEEKGMGQIIGKIVLTGGPCAGKTTALSRIEEELTERGYRVIIVSESATELIKAGVRPFGDKAYNYLDFQRLILEYQLDKEKIYEKAASMLPKDEKTVIIYDRGVMDNKAYVPKEFHDLVEEKSLSELDLLDNYDMVLHLVTAADGCPEFYTLENNQARSESIEEAIELDKKTQEAWLGHNRLVVIDNSSSFEEKLRRVMDNIYQFTNNSYTVRYQRKYLVDLNKSKLDFNKSIASIDIEQTYLDEGTDNYERRLRKRTNGNENTYYLTVQKKAPNGLSKIVTDKKITEKDYLKLLDMSDEHYTIKKTRKTFIYKKQYMKLDIFEDENFGILEVNPINAEQIINLPSYLIIEKEVTDDHDFDNIILAKKKEKCKVKKAQ